jgi:hypothetical protein
MQLKILSPCLSQIIHFPGINNTIPTNLDLSECNTLAEAKGNLKQFYDGVEDFLSNLQKYNCPLPCSHKSYKYNIKYFNKNSWIDTEDSNRQAGRLKIIDRPNKFYLTFAITIFNNTPIYQVKMIGQLNRLLKNANEAK